MNLHVSFRGRDLSFNRLVDHLPHATTVFGRGGPSGGDAEEHQVELDAQAGAVGDVPRPPAEPGGGPSGGDA